MYSNTVKAPRCGGAITFVPVHRRQKQEDHEFKDHSSYTSRPCLKKNQKWYKASKVQEFRRNEKYPNLQEVPVGASDSRGHRGAKISQVPKARPHPALGLPCRLQVDRPGQGGGVVVWAEDTHPQCMEDSGD